MKVAFLFRTFITFCLTTGLAHAASDRDLAEWVIRWEGRVILAGNRQPITDLTQLTKLRGLDLSYTSFSDTGLEGLAGLKQLRRLNLRDTMVTDEGLKHLAGLTSLEELDLSGTRVTDKGVEALRKMTGMRSLNLL